MANRLEGRVAVVTGAGRGIGRGVAHLLAEEGCAVVINDYGVAVDGSQPSSGPAQDVADEIKAKGGRAVANYDTVATAQGGENMVKQALDEFGRLDILINNAGILRDRMLVNMSEEEWDLVIRVHLKGTFAPTHHAAAYWRQMSKSGEDVDARIINTTSTSGVFCNPGQANYAAAKAGIAAFSIIAARELERYGVAVNAIAPAARTRMTEDLGIRASELPPENVSPLVVWLASPEAKGITGRVFGVRGGLIQVYEGWARGPRAEKDGRWDPAELGKVVPDLVAQSKDPEMPREPEAPEAPSEEQVRVESG